MGGGGQLSLSEISSGGQTSIPKISTRGQTSAPKISSGGGGGANVHLAFSTGGKSPIIDLLIGGGGGGGKCPGGICPGI